MTKTQLLESNLWKRTADDEPVFLLVARDAVAPPTIQEWKRLATNAGADIPKTYQALDIAVEMKKRQEKNGRKTPHSQPQPMRALPAAAQWAEAARIAEITTGPSGQCRWSVRSSG